MSGVLQEEDEVGRDSSKLAAGGSTSMGVAPTGLSEPGLPFLPQTVAVWDDSLLSSFVSHQRWLWQVLCRDGRGGAVIIGVFALSRELPKTGGFCLPLPGVPEPACSPHSCGWNTSP